MNDGPDAGHPHYYLYALDAQTGSVLWKVLIQGAAINSPTQTFAPLAERQRTGLLLLNGSIYMGFASYCDYSTYTGYVASVNTTSKAVMIWSTEAGLTDSKAGIWHSGGGLMSDGPGRIFLTTGNGISPAPSAGTSPPQELGDATVRLNVASDGTMSAADYFSPANAPALDSADLDFGSGGPVGLSFGSATYPHLLVQGGKDGRIFLLDSLGGREQGAGNSDLVVSQAGPYQGQWGHPAAFGPTTSVSAATSSDYVYYVDRNDNLRYLQFGVNGSGKPVLTDVANSSTTFNYASGSPVVTSNGNDPASATVWEVALSGSSSMLEAFAGAPAASCTGASPCSMKPIWSAPIGTATGFSVPATDSGRVYVANGDGTVLGFGSPDAAPVGGATPVSFGQVSLGQASAPDDVTVTASAPVTISAVSTSSESSSNPVRGRRGDGRRHRSQPPGQPQSGRHDDRAGYVCARRPWRYRWLASVSGGLLHFAATATKVPNLRTGTHVVGVAVAGQRVTVTVDSKNVLSATLPAGTVPSAVLPAFTGGTGGANDAHSVSAVSVTAGGGRLPAPGGNWSFNGAAQMSGSDTALTQAVKSQAGSVVYPVAVTTLGLHVQFNVQLSGGTGADGFAFALLNPAKSTGTSLGTAGGGLGFAGLSGVAVTLDTYKDNRHYPTNNFAGTQ